MTDTRPVCDYCDQLADHYEADSGAEQPICPGCARDHYGSDWRTSVRKIGPRWFARQEGMERE